jgi:hypothetical protein
MKDIRSQGQGNLQQKEIGSIIKVGGNDDMYPPLLLLSLFIGLVDL